jgi:SAM-dependent methyltransferase
MQLTPARVGEGNGYRSSLRELLSRYGSDKVFVGYVPIYESVFKRLRDEEIRLLEVGVGTMLPDVPSSMVYVFGEGGSYRPGASLRAWRDYFRRGKVYGADVQDDCMLEEEGLVTLKFDSTDREACDAVLGDLTFDVVIDDGLHWGDAQVKTFENLWGRVRAGGYYFIEDVHPPLFDEWQAVFADVEAERWEYSNGRWTFLVFSKP